MKVNLVVIGGKKDGLEIPISTPRFLIGRGNQCHIRPQSNLIGDLHCQISVGNDAVILEDCGGAVGTLVNGTKIQHRYRLQNNDRIKIATLEFAVRLIADELAAKKRPVPKTPNTAGQAHAPNRTSAPVVDKGEADILQWVKQEEKARSSPQEVVTLPYAKLEKSPKKPPVAAAVAIPRKSDDVWKDFDLEPADLLLLLTILPLVGVLLSFLPAFWAWRGGGAMVLAVLTWMFRTHVKRIRHIQWDELNVGIGILATLIVILMLPTSKDLLWQWGTVALLMTLSTVMTLRMQGMAGSKWDDTNLALLGAIALLAYIVNQQMPIAQWGWWGWSVAAFLAISLALGIRVRGMAERRLDDTNAALLAAVGILAFVIVQMCWSAPRWAQLGGTIAPCVGLAVMLGIRVRRQTAKQWDGLNLLLLAQISILFVSLLHAVQPAWEVWRVGAVLLLIALIPLLGIRLVRPQGSRLNEINVALLLQMVLLGLFVAGGQMPTLSQLFGSPTGSWWHGPVWSVLAILILGAALGYRTTRSGGKLDDANVALLAAIALLVFMAVKTSHAAQGTRIGVTVVSLLTLATLSAIRTIRLHGRRLDGLNLLLLAQIGILAASLWHLMKPDLLVWQIGAVALLIVSIPLLGIRMVWPRENRLSEINLALLMQIGLLGWFIAKVGTPSSSQLFALSTSCFTFSASFFTLPTGSWWQWPGWSVAAILVLGIVLGFRMAKSGSKLNDTNVALLAAIALLVFIAVKLLLIGIPGVQLVGMAVPLTALAALFGIRASRMSGQRLDRLNMLLLLQIGILIMPVLQQVWPMLGVWRNGIVLLLVVFVPLLGIGMIRMRGGRINEISLALLVQIGVLAYFTAHWWLPSAWWPFAPKPTMLQLAGPPPSVSPKIPVAKTPAGPQANAPGEASGKPLSKPLTDEPTGFFADALATAIAERLTNAPGYTLTDAFMESLLDAPIDIVEKRSDNALDRPSVDASAAAPLADIPPEPPANVPDEPLGKGADDEPSAEELNQASATALTMVIAKRFTNPLGYTPADALAESLLDGPPHIVEKRSDESPTEPALAAEPVEVFANRLATTMARLLADASGHTPTDMFDGPLADALAQPPANAIVNAPAEAPVNVPEKPAAVPAVNAPAKPPAKMPPAQKPAEPSSSLSPDESAAPIPWAKLSGIAVPLVAIIFLFGMRASRRVENRFDGLNLLLLTQIGVLAIAALHQLLPYWDVWKIGAVLLLLTLTPWLGMRLVSAKENRLNEINVALLIQISLFMIFLVLRWLPMQLTWFVVAMIFLAVPIPLSAIRRAWKSGRRLNEMELILLVQMGVFLFWIANSWLPPFWVRMGEGAILVAALAIILKLHDKRKETAKSDQIMLRLVAVGIALVVILGFLFPIATWG